MSMFGGIDIDDVPESIDRAAYRTKFTDWKYYDLTKKSEDVKYGKGMFVLTFEVSDKESEYLGESGQIFVNVYKSDKLSRNAQKQITFDGEPVESDLQQAIIKAIKFYKQIIESLGVDTLLAEPGKEFDTVKGNEYYLTMYADRESKQTRISANDPIRKAEDVDAEMDSDIDI